MARRDIAQAQLDSALAGPTDLATAQAEAQLAQAEATLEQLLTGASDEQIAIAEAQLEQANISLARAQYDLDQATLVAPFDGIITDVNAQVGTLTTGAVITLADTSELVVVLSVDEIDLADVVVGQPAGITLDAYPDNELTGSVTSIAPTASVAPGTALTSYDVRVAIDPTDLNLRLGMTANAQLTTDQRTDVLLVPNSAINADRQAGTYSVNRVQADGTTEAIPVTIGLRDNRYTEITGGLEAGDELIIGEIITEPAPRPGQGRGPFGGG